VVHRGGALVRSGYETTSAQDLGRGFELDGLYKKEHPILGMV